MKYKITIAILVIIIAYQFNTPMASKETDGLDSKLNISGAVIQCK